MTKPRKKRQKPRRAVVDRGRLREISGLLLLTAAVLSTLALIIYSGEPDGAKSSGNLLGPFGAYLAYILAQFFFGRWPAFVFPFLLFLWSSAVFFQWKKIRLIGISGGVLAAAFWAAVTISLLEVPHPESEHAGFLGKSFGMWLYGFTGPVGAWIFWVLVVAVAGIVLFRLKPSRILGGILQGLKAALVWIWAHRPRRFPRFRPSKRKSAAPPETAAATTFPETETSDRVSQPYDLFPPEEEPVAEPAEESSPPEPPQTASGTEAAYLLPPLSILADPPPESPDAPEELKAKAKRLFEALTDFGVGAKVVKVNPGPVITRFDLKPDPGVKVSRISNLADDLALVLRAKAIRIQAPIPGQGAVGVEIPNQRPSLVALKSVAGDPAFQEHPSPLAIALGSTASGDPYISDLAKMPHLLVAGTTGSGKSVCLNAVIASLLLRNPPERLQFVIIDPKKLELSIYARLARHHLLVSDELDEEVITTAANAVRVLGGVEMEMARRYDLLSSVGVRNIEEFNRLAEAGKAVSVDGEILHPLCYLIIVIDELADLMMIAAKDIEEPIARLAQMARAVGIHLIVATQRPSVDVITGIIKANFPARLAFQVASKIDSRTILDVNGAEALLGNGDALFIPPGRGQPERIHCCYVSHEEIEAIVSHIEDQPCEFHRQPLRLPRPDGMTVDGEDVFADRDELFEEAARMVIHQGQASVSILQRRFKIGYARAGRLIDQLERAGIVGPFDGSKAREVLVDEDYLDRLIQGPEPPE